MAAGKFLTDPFLNKNSSSIGHQGNSGMRSSGAEATISQSLEELFSNSNHINSIPLLSLLTQIFKTSQASPFTGLESTGLLKFITGDALGALKSLSTIQSVLSSIPGIKSFGGNSRGK
jgi:hypothetical protein